MIEKSHTLFQRANDTYEKREYKRLLSDDSYVIIQEHGYGNYHFYHSICNGSVEVEFWNKIGADEQIKQIRVRCTHCFKDPKWQSIQKVRKSDVFLSLCVAQFIDINKHKGSCRKKVSIPETSVDDEEIKNLDNIRKIVHMENDNPIHQLTTHVEPTEQQLLPGEVITKDPDHKVTKLKDTLQKIQRAIQIQNKSLLDARNFQSLEVVQLPQGEIKFTEAILKMITEAVPEISVTEKVMPEVKIEEQEQNFEASLSKPPTVNVNTHIQVKEEVESEGTYCFREGNGIKCKQE
jgi:hypothetical protein